jgi:hypothetical protein
MIFPLFSKNRLWFGVWFSLLLAGLSPASLLGAGFTYSRGGVTAIGHDGAADSLENPAGLGFNHGQHDIYAGVRGRLMSFGADELNLKADSFMAESFNHSDITGTLAYSYHGLADHFDLGLAIRYGGEEDSRDALELRGRYNYFSDGELNIEYGNLNHTININPAFAWSPNKEFHFGFATSVVLLNGQQSLRYLPKDSSRTYEELETLTGSGLMIRPSLGLLYQENGERSEMGIRFIPIIFQSSKMEVTKKYAQLSEGVSSKFERSFETDDTNFRLGRAAVGFSEDFIPDLLLSVEGRMSMPYTATLTRPAFTLASSNNSLSLDYGPASYELEMETERGLSVGLSSFHVDKMEFLVGFRYDEAIGSESLTGSDTFWDIQFTERSYELSLGYVWLGFKDIKLAANFAMQQNILRRNYTIEYPVLDNQIKREQRTRFDGFVMSLAYLQTIK